MQKLREELRQWLIPGPRWAIAALSLLVILVLVLLITQPPGEFYPTPTPPQGSDAGGTLTVTLPWGSLTPTATISETYDPFGTPQSTFTPRISNTPTASVTPTWYIRTYPSRTPFRFPTWTRTPTRSRTPTVTRTGTSTSTPTVTNTATSTATSTGTATGTATQTATATLERTYTPTITLTPTQTNTFTSTPTTRPERIAFSADITGDGQADLLTSSAGGTGLVTLVQDGDAALMWDWSSDAAWLLYSQAGEIRRVRPDGSWDEAIPGQPAGVNDQAAWSPNRAWIVFVNENGGQTDLYVIRSDGSDLRAVTGTTAVESAPDWLPDGSAIVYASGGDLYQLNLAAWLNDPSQTLPDPLALTATTEEEAWPRVSPAGTSIAFARLVDGQWDIFTAPLSDLGSALALTDTAGNNTQPAWSRTGARLAFISDRSGSQQLWIMNADGSTQSAVSNYVNGEQNPAWMP